MSKRVNHCTEQKLKWDLGWEPTALRGPVQDWLSPLMSQSPSWIMKMEFTPNLSFKAVLILNHHHQHCHLNDNMMSCIFRRWWHTRIVYHECSAFYSTHTSVLELGSSQSSLRQPSSNHQNCYCHLLWATCASASVFKHFPEKTTLPLLWSVMIECICYAAAFSVISIWDRRSNEIWSYTSWGWDLIELASLPRSPSSPYTALCTVYTMYYPLLCTMYTALHCVALP